MGESFYTFKYYSYRDGAVCEYKMPSDEYEELAKKYHEHEDLMKRQGIKSVEEYIKTVLALNN